MVRRFSDMVEEVRPGVSAGDFAPAILDEASMALAETDLHGVGPPRTWGR